MGRVLTLLLAFLVMIPLLSVKASSGEEDLVYTYEMMVSDTHRLANKFPGLITFKSIGKTKFNRDIIAIKLGTGKHHIFINGSHHAREWMTTVLVMKMIEEYANASTNKTDIEGLSPTNILKEVSIWFVPMVNPDGVTLQQQGLSAFPSNYHKTLLKMNENSRDFTRWKANAEGIDLNRQYPAKWGTASESSHPSWRGYKGKYPFQALEVIAIRDFTYEINPEIAVSYHSSGRVLYWYFNNTKSNYERDFNLAQKFSQRTNYQLVPANQPPSGKGYTDWFIQQFGKAGFTPEISYPVGNRHVPISVFPEVWKRNKSIGLWLAAECYDMQNNLNNITAFNEKIKVSGKTNVYSQPSFLADKLTTIEPQMILSKRKNNNWYYVNTNNGDGWIYVAHEKTNFPNRTFLDVPSNYWAKNEIDFVHQKKWMLGKTNEKFAPTSNITRAEFAVVLVRTLKLPLIEKEEKSFSDVDKNHWAYAYIETAKNSGFLLGYGDGSFKPDSPINREQVAVLLARILKEECIVVEAPYSDIAIDHWAVKEITLLKKKKILLGFSDGSFGSEKKTSRAEVAVIMKRLAQTMSGLY